MQSDVFGTDSKRAIINLEVKQDDNYCVWTISCSIPDPAYPSCDSGEFSGELSDALWRCIQDDLLDWRKAFSLTEEYFA